MGPLLFDTFDISRQNRVFGCFDDKTRLFRVFGVLTIKPVYDPFRRLRAVNKSIIFVNFRDFR